MPDNIRERSKWFRANLRRALVEGIERRGRGGDALKEGLPFRAT
jgi:hypothetical protein